MELILGLMVQGAQMMLVLAMAPLLTGFVRKVKARLLRRRGPPLFQPYRDLLRLMRKEVVLAENPCVVKLANSWIIMNPGGGPTPDKPGISVVPYEPSDEVSTFLNLRVADIDACYRDWKAKGAEFVTEPIDRVAEVRCYMRDPDGYLIEVGQATGMLEGKFARKRPEDLRG